MRCLSDFLTSVDFSARITQPADFMSLIQSRRVTEPPKPPTQEIKPAQGPVLPRKPEVKVPSSGNKEKKAEKTAILPSKPSSPPVEAAIRPSRAIHVEKKASTKATNIPATKLKASESHIGPYPVQTPPKSPPSAPVAKGPVSSKSSKATAAALGPLQQITAGVPVEKLSWKISPNEEPRKQAGSTPSKKRPSGPSMPPFESKRPPVTSGPPAKDSKQITPASSQKTKEKTKSKQNAPPEPLLDVSPSSAGVSTVGEGPAAPSHFKAKAKATKAQANLVGDMDPFGASAAPAAAGLAKSKQTAPPEHLLDLDPPSACFPTIGESPVAPSRSKAKAIASPGAAQLAGLKFMERPVESKPAKTIDEIISTNLMDQPIVLTPTTQPSSKEKLGKSVLRAQSDRDEDVPQSAIFDKYGLQILEELRNLGKAMRPPDAHDLEKIVESKIREMVLAHEPLGASSAAKRDVTPFERHRSPPPPSSSDSNSPASAEKRKSKPRVPGLSPGLSPARSEDSDIITRLESLQVSDKLAAPLQPQRATNATLVPSPKPIEVSKRPSTLDADIPVKPTPTPRSPTPRSPTPRSPTPRSPTPRSREKLSKKSLSLHESIHAGPAPSSKASVSSKASTIGAHAGRTRATTQALSANHPNVPKQEDDKPRGVRVIGPPPYRSTASGENQSSQQKGRIFSMPDAATLSQPKVKTLGPPPFQPRK
jgi:hypothetical protein